MRDPGLARAIDKGRRRRRACRKIGIAQPSVSNWNRCAAQRVIAFEAATGISRRDLRPDLYDESENAVADHAVDPSMPTARTNICCWLHCSRRRRRRSCSAHLRSWKRDTQLGRARAALAEAAQDAAAAAIEREYFDLFIGVGRGEILLMPPTT